SPSILLKSLIVLQKNIQQKAAVTSSRAKTMLHAIFVKQIIILLYITICNTFWVAKGPFSKNQTKVFQNVDRKTRCPKKWIGFGSSCYFLSEESKTWDEAREFCRARGADLVVINTEEENEFISALKKQQVWIGLTDRDLEGTWKSVDGSSLNLTFWGSGQPDDYDKEEDCGETNFEFLGHWNDVPCHLSRQLICEKEEIVILT
uniref:C-type lectin domain-containing protein n=1 Tax=Oryzias latipes TaxID=8090 RepID=A0A3B3H7A8_ORYLA